VTKSKRAQSVEYRVFHRPLPGIILLIFQTPFHVTMWHTYYDIMNQYISVNCYWKILKTVRDIRLRELRIIFLPMQNSSRCGTSYEKLIHVKPCNKTNCIISINTSYRFRSYWPNSSIKYMISKTQNIIHVYWICENTKCKL
jgi:hypothetical protein